MEKHNYIIVIIFFSIAFIGGNTLFWSHLIWWELHVNHYEENHVCLKLKIIFLSYISLQLS